MRKVLALDVSTTTTGYVVMSEKLKILKLGEFNIKERGLTDIQYAVAITKEVFKVIKKHIITDLVIEDVFFGKNVANLKTWCRVHGAIGLSWSLKYNDPTFIMPQVARKLVDIPGNSTKIEIQLVMGKEFKLIENNIYYDYCGLISKLLKKKESKEINKNQFDYQMKKISKSFEKDTNISEHIADAILLAKAYFVQRGK